MGVSIAKKLFFFSLVISILLLGFFPIPSYSAPIYFGRFSCNIGGRRLPYSPPSPVRNQAIGQDSPRAPPIKE